MILSPFRGSIKLKYRTSNESCLSYFQEMKFKWSYHFVLLIFMLKLQVDLQMMKHYIKRSHGYDKYFKMPA